VDISSPLVEIDLSEDIVFPLISWFENYPYASKLPLAVLVPV
jgi:hypothetical protein